MHFSASLHDATLSGVEWGSLTGAELVLSMVGRMPSLLVVS